MDEQRFDRLTRTLAGAGSRRGFLKAAAAAVVGGLVAWSGGERAEAARRRGQSTGLPCRGNGTCPGKLGSCYGYRSAKHPGTCYCSADLPDYCEDLQFCTDASRDPRRCGRDCVDCTATGKICVNGECCAGGKVCGDQCCDDDEACISGRCRRCKKPKHLCGNECCDGICDATGKQCCSEEQTCGSGNAKTCCASNETCISGVCTHCTCGVVHGLEVNAAEATCCPPERCCNGTCCAAGEVCRNGACAQPCAEGTTGCGAGCCPNGQACCHGVCCGAGQSCGGNGACTGCSGCADGDVCDNGTCLTPVGFDCLVYTGACGPNNRCCPAPTGQTVYCCGDGYNCYWFDDDSGNRVASCFPL